uniref:Outer membrane assembly protein, YaeT n=1 Tax=uncultured organism TaxID=155900 RepID=M1PVU6_9ZZZZ|nr:outer membrane assembly protein, YaeT [uncultured organism]
MRHIDPIIKTGAAVLLFVCLAAAAGAQSPSKPSPIIDKIRIDIEDGVKDTARWENIARHLIFLKEGERFSEKGLFQSIEALKQSNLFKAIDIPDPDFSARDFTLVFRLTPYPRIKNIVIDGGFPLLEKEIKNVMTFAAGDAYKPETLDKQTGYIKELFKKEGYIDPEVEIAGKKDPADGNYVVDVTIEPGDFYGIRTVDIHGNQAFSDSRLKIRLATWQASLLLGGPSRFVASDLKADVKTLQKFYWEKGYCEAEVESNVEKKPEKADVDIDLIVEEGPYYEVDIRGNDFYWDFTLHNDLAFYEDGNANDFGLKKSRRAMRQRYKNAGFLDADIDTEDENTRQNGETIRKLRFNITEGPRYLVRAVNISGNRSFTDKRIKNQMLTGPPGWLADGQYDPQVLAEDRGAIRSFYRQNGFMSPKVDSKIRRQKAPEDDMISVDIDVKIQEGPRTRISAIGIKGLSKTLAEKIRSNLPMAKGDPFWRQQVENSGDIIAARVSERGFPHVKVDTEVAFTADKTDARIYYTVDKGPYVKMGETFFTGNFKTRRKIFDREMDMAAGDAFSLSEMLSSQRDIRDISALESARFQTIGLEEKQKRVDMLAEVNERPPYFFQFAAGYDTRRLFYLNTGIGDNNLLGLNKQLRANLELSQIGYAAEVGLTEPRLFGTKIVADASIYTEEIEELNKDFGVRNVGAALNFTRPLTRHVDGRLGFSYDFRDQYRTDDTPIPPDEAEQYEPRAVFVTAPSLIYNTTDSFIRPTRGTNTRVSVDVSKGIENTLDDFVKYRVNARYYYTPIEWLTVALRGRAGYIDPYGGDDLVPDDQLFFLGGTSDVRGFDENSLRVDAENDPVGGRTSLMGTVELRFDLGWNFEFVSFYDTGTIRDPNRDAGAGDWRAGAGIGLRYITAIGPIGLLHGWKLDRKPDESPGAFHFTIGYSF